MIYNIKELRTEYEKGKKLDFLFFFGHKKPENGEITETCLSQW